MISYIKAILIFFGGLIFIGCSAQINGSSELNITEGSSPTISNTKPVANAGKDITTTDRQVTLDAKESYDNEDSISSLNFSWEENGNVLDNRQQITLSNLNVGVHTIVLTVTDTQGLSSNDTVIVTINNKIDSNTSIPTKSLEINLCANKTAYLDNNFTLGMQINTQTITGSVFQKSQDFTGAAFCGEFPNALTSADVLNSLKKSFTSATNIVTRNNPDGSIKVQYEILNENIKAYSLLKNILTEAGVQDFTNYIDYTTNKTIKDVYIDLFIHYVNSNTVYVILVVSDKNVDNTNSINQLVDINTIAPTQTVKVTTSENFTYKFSSLKSDILFIMDDSGSMSEEQDSAAKAISDTFGPAMTSKNIDWKATVIGTEYGVDYSLNINDFIENDVSSLSFQLKDIGLYGYDERGLSIAYNYLSNGSIKIRANSKLSIVYISDEIEHSDLYYDLGAMDINDTYFVKNNIKVNVIIPTDGEYEYGDIRNNDLAYKIANITGGEIANLRNYTTGYNAMMIKIANDAAGTASDIVLSKSPIVSSISVKVNGNQIDNKNWNYNISNKSIVFISSATPQNNDKIEVSYLIQ